MKRAPSNAVRRLGYAVLWLLIPPLVGQEEAPSGATDSTSASGGRGETGTTGPAAPPIRSISFSGTPSIPDATLLDVIGHSVGEPWNAVVETACTARLQAWPFVKIVGPHQVQRNGESVDVTFFLSEVPVFGKITVRGNNVFSNRSVVTESALKPGEPVTEEALRTAETRVEEKYNRDGFLLTSVQARTHTVHPRRIDVTLEVAHGARVHIRRLTLRGAEQIAATQALSILQTRPRRLFGVVARGYYVPSVVEHDLARLEAFYHGRGFLAARVGLAEFNLEENYRTVDLALEVDEGPRYMLREVFLEGNTLFSTTRLKNELAVRTGEPFSDEALSAGIRRVMKWYQERADRIPKITAEPPTFGPDRTVTVTLRIDERTPLVTGEVRITGNSRTRERVVRQDVTVAPGEPFTILEMERTLKRMRRRGHFREVNWKATASELDNPPDSEYVDVEVDVVEHRERGRLQVGGGASSGEGEVAYFAIQQPNFDLFRLPHHWGDWSDAFVGGGQRLDIELIPGNRETEYRFRLEEPYFFRSDLSLWLQGASSRLGRREYDESHLQATTGLRKYFDVDRNFSAALSYTLDSVRIHDLDDDAPPDAVDARGYTRLGYPRLELRYNNTERNFFSGDTGLRLLGQADLADRVTGSQVEFLRLRARADYALGLWDGVPDRRHVLHSAVEVGTIEDNGHGDVPLFERFFLGGPRDFRGFDYRQLGPHQGNTPVGGEGMIHGTIDYSFPLFWREIRGVALLDWGDLAPTFSRISTGRFRTALGGGVRFRLNLLGNAIPASLYWVQALSSEAGDDEQRFSFSLGYAF